MRKMLLNLSTHSTSSLDMDVKCEQEVGESDFFKHSLKRKFLGSSGTQFEGWLYKHWRAMALQTSLSSYL